MSESNITDRSTITIDTVRMEQYSEVETKTLVLWLDLNLCRLDVDLVQQEKGTPLFDEATRNLIVGEVALVGAELWERGYYAQD